MRARVYAGPVAADAFIFVLRFKPTDCEYVTDACRDPLKRSRRRRRRPSVYEAVSGLSEARYQQRVSNPLDRFKKLYGAQSMIASEVDDWWNFQFWTELIGEGLIVR